MKSSSSSLGKQLKRFALSKSSDELHKDNKKDPQFMDHFDVLSLASQDMKDMRNCCDSLLSAAAATSNSAYEFSESLLEMGSCLLERPALGDSGECGRALSLLGQVQLELQKLVDGYRAHVIQTITYPSESLLAELRKVEEMKLLCDGKREMYEHMMTQNREKGKPKSGKGESFTSQQLQAAREEYDEVARLCAFRVESLKQGQSRSLLTQAARHHTAQLVFFRKGLKSLEAVEPYIRSVAQNQHIDCEISELVEMEGGDDGGNNYDPHDDGELSFDNKQSKQEQENACTSRNSMELDQDAAPTTHASGLEDLELDFGSKKAELLFSRKSQSSSHSAPIYAEKFDLSQKLKEMQTLVPKIHAYALPTPSDAKNSISKAAGSVIHSTGTGISGNNSRWHSSPLDTEKMRKCTDDNSLARHISKARLVVKDSDSRYPSVPLPSPLAGGILPPQSDFHSGSDARKVERQAFSGPLLSKPSFGKPLLSSSSGPIGPTDVPPSYSGMLSRVATPVPPSALCGPQSVSPPLTSSPRISELYELPRPPASLACKLTGESAIAHSAPLTSRNQEVSPSNKFSLPVSNTGSLLPPPPLALVRSFSIPTSNHRAAVMANEKESPSRDKAEVPSPPLTPISLSNMASTTVPSQLPSTIGHIKVVAGKS